MKIYLDTSVPSACFDERTPERRALTLAMWPALGQHDVCISDLVLEEIKLVPDAERRQALLDSLRLFRCLGSNSDDVAALADAYVALGALPASARADAFHVAVAVVNGMERLSSRGISSISSSCAPGERSMRSTPCGD